jgi:hypothetical protein
MRKVISFSHTFRGSSQRYENPTATLNGLEKSERCAIDSVLSVVQAVTCADEIQSHLEMLPSYFGTMITFAFVLLLKASSQKITSFPLDKSDVVCTLKRLATVFSACSERVQPKHPLHSVTKSLNIAMRKHCFADPLEGRDMVVAQDETLLGFDNVGDDPFGMIIL